MGETVHDRAAALKSGGAKSGALRIDAANRTIMRR
jgi:hypothetical protein